MGRTIAGALLILVTCFLARGPSLVAGGGSVVRGGSSFFAGSGHVDGLYPAPRRDSLPIQPAPPDSTPSRRSRPKQGHTVPVAFVRNPLAFLSRAPVDSLVLLKGIGPVLAERIAVARSGKGPFTSWNDILSIQGIGPKKVLMLKEQANAAE